MPKPKATGSHGARHATRASTCTSVANAAGPAAKRSTRSPAHPPPARVRTRSFVAVAHSGAPRPKWYTDCVYARVLYPALHLRPGIAQADRAVEHGSARLGIGVEAEVALALELDRCAGLGSCKRRLKSAFGKHFDRIRIEIGGDIAAAGVRPCEQRIVEPHFRRDRVRGRNAMQRRLHLGGGGRRF